MQALREQQLRVAQQRYARTPHLASASTSTHTALVPSLPLSSSRSRTLAEEEARADAMRARITADVDHAVKMAKLEAEVGKAASAAAGKAGVAAARAQAEELFGEERQSIEKQHALVIKRIERQERMALDAAAAAYGAECKVCGDACAALEAELSEKSAVIVAASVSEAEQKIERAVQILRENV